MGRKKFSFPKEVFLSHSSDDRAFVRKLVNMLRGNGVPVWYSETNILGARQWHDEIGAALSRCDWFAIALSPNATKSKWVKRELLFALENDRYEDKIVPLLYKPCDYSATLSWTLPSFQRIDFTGEFQDGCC
jgi:hypothetical protein